MEKINSIDLIWVIVLIGIVWITFTVIKEAKGENKEIEVFKKSTFKIAKITDNIGNSDYKIVMEDINGIYRELEQYLTCEKNRYRILKSKIYDDYKNYTKPFTNSNDAQKELNKLQVNIGQLKIEKNIELQ